MIQAEAVDATSVYQRIPGFVEATGRSMMEEILLTARNLARSLAYSTQPYGLDRGAERVGRRAVSRDLGRVFMTPSRFYDSLEEREPVEASAFWKAWKARDLSTVREIAERSSLGVEVMDSPDPALHRARRDARGRVRGKRATALVLDRQAMVAYRQKIENRVGSVKAGYAKAADDIGGGNFPAWASTRHGHNSGRADISSDPLRPEVILHNDVPWAREVLPTQEEAAAVDIAEERLLQRLEIILSLETEDPF